MKNRINISLLLLSFSLFLFQVCLLRIFSVSDYYHFAFMIVSIALLGFGISGSFLYFFINKLKNTNLILIFFASGFAISVPVSFVISNLVPFDSFRIAWEPGQILYLAVYYIFLVLPFFFGGSFIGYAFYCQEKPGATYFYNNIGSALGAVAALVVIQFLGKSGALYISSAVGLISAGILINKKYLKRTLSLVAVFVVAIALMAGFFPGAMEINMSPYKSLPTVLRFPESRVEYSTENSYARLDVIESPSIKSAPGLSLKYQKVPPPQKGITIDGDNLSAVTSSDGGIENFKFLDYMPASVIFKARPCPRKVLVIEPGGGMDMLASLYFESRSVSVTENDSLVLEVMNGALAGYSGSIYRQPQVEVFEVSSRNFSKISSEKFDLIIVSLADSFHPISAGAYSLNENYLYTVESFCGLIGLLKNDGAVAITRWAQFPPSENLKILSTLYSSLRISGVENIAGKIFAFRSWSTLTTIYKADGFSREDTLDLKSKLKDLNFDVVYYKGAGEQEANIYSRLEEPYFYRYYREILEGSESSRESLYRDYYFNIYPAYDDKPYFFNFFRFGQVPDIIKYFGKSTQPFGGGGYLILVVALFISIILSILFILLPLRVKRIKLELRKDFRYIIYFFCLGFGFFFVELPFIQKFILILGKPAFALAIVLFSVMLAAGIGSFLTSRYHIDIRWAVGFIVAYIAFFVFGFRFLGDFIISAPLWQRFFYSILLILPLGFVMGMPFPLAIAKIKLKREGIIPWLWAINGCASVVGSVAAVMISIHIGFSAVIGIAAAIYLGAAVTYRYF